MGLDGCMMVIVIVQPNPDYATAMLEEALRDGSVCGRTINLLEQMKRGAREATVTCLCVVNA